jgi:uncharacterized protein with HEPN domain
MDERDKVLLLEMLESAERACLFVKGKSREDLEKNHALLGFATVRAMEVLITILSGRL